MLTSADFISPTGELAPDLFPGENLTTLTAAWLADALTRTSNESAQRAWVHHRAYTSVANRFHAGLASESEGPISASRSAEQFRYWSRRAREHLRAYQSLASAPVVTETTAIW